jgi:hypothetical protein
MAAIAPHHCDCGAAEEEQPDAHEYDRRYEPPIRIQGEELDDTNNDPHETDDHEKSGPRRAASDLSRRVARRAGRLA